MSTLLLRVSIPPRLRDEMMFNKHAAFDVENTPDGAAFVTWWEKAGAAVRDEVMRTAYDRNISIVEALKQKLEAR